MQFNVNVQGSTAKVLEVAVGKLRQTADEQQAQAAQALQSSPMAQQVAGREELRVQMAAEGAAVKYTVDALAGLLDATLRQAADQGVQGVSVSVNGSVTARNVGLSINVGELPNFIG